MSFFSLNIFYLFLAVFVGLGVSVALIALIVNAAMCYSCSQKSDAIQRYKDAIISRRSKFQVNFPKSFNSFKLSDLKGLVTEIPGKVRDFVQLKLNNRHFNSDETYDEMSNSYGPGCGGRGGSISGASTASKISINNLNEPVIYNSGAESVYNSGLSDSASVSIVPPPPPPPPPAITRSHLKKKKRNKTEITKSYEDENSYNNNQFSIEGISDSKRYHGQSDEEQYNDQLENQKKNLKKPSSSAEFNKNTNKLRYHRQF